MYCWAFPTLLKTWKSPPAQHTTDAICFSSLFCDISLACLYHLHLLLFTVFTSSVNSLHFLCCFKNPKYSTNPHLNSDGIITHEVSLTGGLEKHVELQNWGSNHLGLLPNILCFRNTRKGNFWRIPKLVFIFLNTLFTQGMLQSLFLYLKDTKNIYYSTYITYYLLCNKLLTRTTLNYKWVNRQDEVVSDEELSKQRRD